MAKEAAGEEWARRTLQLWMLRFHGGLMTKKIKEIVESGRTLRRDEKTSGRVGGVNTQ